MRWLTILAALIALPVHAQTSFNLATVAPSRAPLIGPAPHDFAKTVQDITGGELTISVAEPGALVPPLEVFDAVSRGAVGAGWAPAIFWSGKIASAPLFSAVPFGPDAEDYLGWMRHGGGHELWLEALAPHNIHAITCGITPPEASGWFRDPIDTVDDLQGLKMRFSGLGARVMDKLGVATQLIAPPDIFTSLQLGTIDAAEFSMPAIDLGLGLDQIAKNYYFPGWHQPYTLIDLLIHKSLWEDLSEPHKLVIQTACDARIILDLAAGAPAQANALDALAAKGVTIKRWDEAMIQAFEMAWSEVVAEQSAANTDFARAWESLSAYLTRNGQWRGLSAID